MGSACAQLHLSPQLACLAYLAGVGRVRVHDSLVKRDQMCARQFTVKIIREASRAGRASRAFRASKADGPGGAS